MLDLDVRPAEQPAVAEHEGLDRESSPAGLERAVLGEQRLFRRSFDADDGPVGLLSGHSAREGAMRGGARDRLKERLGRGAEGALLQPNLCDRIVGRRPGDQMQTHESGLRIR